MPVMYFEIWLFHIQWFTKTGSISKVSLLHLEDDVVPPLWSRFEFWPTGFVFFLFDPAAIEDMHSHGMNGYNSCVLDVCLCPPLPDISRNTSKYGARNTSSCTSMSVVESGATSQSWRHSSARPDSFSPVCLLWNIPHHRHVLIPY